MKMSPFGRYANLGHNHRATRALIVMTGVGGTGSLSRHRSTFSSRDGFIVASPGIRAA